MSHTNVQIPSYLDTEDRRQRAVTFAELEFWKGEAGRLRTELENIPEAVERWGYVDLPMRSGEMRLVRKDMQGDDDE